MKTNFNYRALLTVLFTLILTAVTAQAAQAQTFTVIHNFTGGSDGEYPLVGLTMDRAGNFYGTAAGLGPEDPGSVYELKPSGSGWILTTLYKFSGGADGGWPLSRVVFGPDGTLYGATAGGGFCQDCGTVFKLTPRAIICPVSCPWMETVLYRFNAGADGGYPTGELALDSAGNIYGTTFEDGVYGYGVVFKLTHSGGSWNETPIHTFARQTVKPSPYEYACIN